jgi:hypothetical protein
MPRSTSGKAVSIASELVTLSSSLSLRSTISLVGVVENIVLAISGRFGTRCRIGGGDGRPPLVHAHVRILVRRRLLLTPAAELRTFLDVCHPTSRGICQCP